VERRRQRQMCIRDSINIHLYSFNVRNNMDSKKECC
jgi:hypothetical protein